MLMFCCKVILLLLKSNLKMKNSNINENIMYLIIN